MQLVKGIPGLFSTGDYMNVKLQLDLILWEVLMAAGEKTICSVNVE